MLISERLAELGVRHISPTQVLLRSQNFLELLSDRSQETEESWMNQAGSVEGRQNSTPLSVTFHNLPDL